MVKTTFKRVSREMPILLHVDIYKAEGHQRGTEHFLVGFNPTRPHKALKLHSRLSHTVQLSSPEVLSVT